MDPFPLVNKAYTPHVSARPDMFLTNAAEPSPSPDDRTRTLYNLNLTLLPNQIFVLPKTLEERIDKSVFSTHYIYTDSDIR